MTTSTRPSLAQTAKKSQIWLAIRLSHFALESLGVSRHTTNIMVASKGYICAATDNLCALGIENGMPAATAQLLHNIDDTTPCRTYERELDSEEQCLEDLCHALYNFTPHIEVYRVATHEGAEDIGLALELSRCITLFKGLNPLCEHIFNTLKSKRLSYCYAQGHTKHMAWLLSYRPRADAIAESNTAVDFNDRLADLPLDYIHAFPEVVRNLKKTGFFYFRDIARQIQDASLHSLRTRFGDTFFEYLMALYDIDRGFTQASLFQTPAAYYEPKEIFVESIEFDYPVSNCEQLHAPVKTLLDQLTQELIKTQKQTQSILWRLYDIYHNQECVQVNLERLHRDSQLAEELTMIQLENQPLPFEVDALELRCEHLFPVNFTNTSLDNNYSGVQEHAFATVTAKLNARLGEHAVFTLSPKDSHIPELSFRKVPVKQHTPNEEYTEPKKINADRPGWIFNIPVKIGQRQNALYWKGKLELLQGPERIEGLWWKKPTARDYFIAKRDDNVRLWVFHDLHKNEWFAHGVFA